MSVSSGFAFAKLPLRFLLGGNGIAAAAARSGATDALEQFADSSHDSPQHLLILARATLKGLHGPT